MKKILFLTSILLSSNLFAQQAQQELAETILNIFKENNLSKLSEYVITLEEAKQLLVKNKVDTNSENIKKYLSVQEEVVKTELLKLDSIYNGYYWKVNRHTNKAQMVYLNAKKKIDWANIEVKEIKTVQNSSTVKDHFIESITTIYFKHKRKNYYLRFDSNMVNNKLKLGYNISING